MRYAPSIACADQLNLEAQTRELLALGMEDIHYDIMDGNYVPNLCLSLDTAAGLKAKFPKIRLDVHLMVTDPASYIDRLAALGAHQVGFHIDATPFAVRTLAALRERGMRAGLVLNPSQAPELLLPCLSMLDFVLVMSIEPGFAGLPFLEASYERVETLARWRGERGLGFEIAVDGGITAPIACRLSEAGADRIVLGYPILFGQPDGITGAWRRQQPVIEGKQEGTASL